MPKFEESVKITITQIEEKHKNEMNDLRKKQKIDFNKIKAYAPSEILNLRKRMDTFTSAGEYADAKKVKAQLFELENDWINRFEDKLKEKWEDQIDKLIDKQEKEVKSALAKMDKHRQLKRIQWNKDEKILTKRYNNVRSDLMNQQKIEKQKLAKEF